MQESDVGYDEFVWREDAVERVGELRGDALARQPTRSIPLAEIGGQVLAEAVVAEQDYPAVDFATMDGYAFNANDEYPLSVIDRDVFPEDTAPQLEAGQAIRIATGAPLPEQANAVLKREDATVEDDELTGTVEVSPGTYTYERGSNVSAGETVFEPGERLSPKDAILLGDLGCDEVETYVPFSVGILATGTEIHEGQSRDLDSPMLAGLVSSWGHDPTYEGTVPDQYEVVEDRIRELALEYDVVLTTGGTSVGKKDHVIRALDALGAVLFHNVRIRPGKPIAVASLVEYDAVVFAIPGKPVGAHSITSLVARPFFTGRTIDSAVEVPVLRDVGISREGFEYAVPVTFEEDGVLPLGHVDSMLRVYDGTFNPSVLSSSTRATRATGFFLTTEGVTAGETVQVVPYSVVE